jgi:hypothetical protein
MFSEGMLASKDPPLRQRDRNDHFCNLVVAKFTVREHVRLWTTGARLSLGVQIETNKNENQKWAKEASRTDIPSEFRFKACSRVETIESCLKAADNFPP